MSPPTRRKLELKLPIHLETDLAAGPGRVWIRDAHGRELGLVDRPFGEWLVALLDQLRAAA